ncbi:hypothetical protein [Paenibacillus sp. PL91]|uniref:hypothetical protein n=1 Tax=Paenibacillus sp. PL91 TaxID=2729538 RepID=UPI00145E035D|nr:hypothetical protein [Paenibacillus sp. PL91]MBC9204051.1 hypothetical protein [Paenibacillus sp. PL91]
MRITVFSIFICLLFTLCACGMFSNKPMPTSTAHVENTDIIIPVKVHYYDWGGKYEYGDSATIDVEVEPAIIPPNSKIVFSFDRKPKEISSLREVLSREESNTLDSSSNEILVPYTNGIHTYAYTAKWPEGFVVFVFKVEVN